MKFTKMHGIGNDYVYINCFEEQIADRAALAVRVSDRHFGIGSDGLICIDSSERADFLMDMYNADGSKSQMCGNGIRCVGKYVYDKGLTDKTTITVESGGEIKTLDLIKRNGVVRLVRVNMGRPVFTPARIPVNATGKDFVNQPIEVLGKQYYTTCLSMGNPHAVVFMPDVYNTSDLYALDLLTIGPAFEHHILFPERINTEFIQVENRETLNMRVWERGSGETLACGTGACASVVAGVLGGLCDNIATVYLRGGALEIEWDRDKTGCVFMTGPAETVFEGEMNYA
ncbi:MAG: diaminopimelate epimerase [Oscillospiraceae bacterium]|nr:diaminopimelate epimerase [Oscillospiraceae bacterium]